MHNTHQEAGLYLIMHWALWKYVHTLCKKVPLTVTASHVMRFSGRFRWRTSCTNVQLTENRIAQRANVGNNHINVCILLRDWIFVLSLLSSVRKRSAAVASRVLLMCPECMCHPHYICFPFLLHTRLHTYTHSDTHTVAYLYPPDVLIPVLHAYKVLIGEKG